MTSDERSHNERLLDKHQKRLHVLELQAAQFGMYVPAHIVTEIAEIKEEINRLQNVLGITKGTPAASPNPPPPRTLPSEQHQLSASKMIRLIELLLAAPAFAERGTRDSIVQLLPNAVRNSIGRSDIARVDVLNIVRTSLNYPNGLKELLDAARFFEGNSLLMEQIDAFVTTLPG